MTSCTIITTSYNTESGQLILVKIRMTLPVLQLLCRFRLETFLLNVVNCLILDVHVPCLTTEMWVLYIICHIDTKLV
jgi:hypothetical protein